MRTQDILVRPMITERASLLKERYNKVTFEVATEANKYQIKDAVESFYGVKVATVHTLIVPGKQKRRGRSVGKQPSWKKATITLKPGETIDFFATE